MLNDSERDHLRVVLVAARNPLNIGAAARAISNFGFSHLRVVNPYEIAFREARSAVGAAQLLSEAQEFTNLADAVADCTLVIGTTAASRRDLQHSLRSLPSSTGAIRKQLRSGQVGLLFGSEKFGLSNQDLSHCHWLVRIPTREQHSSMNLGQAVAVCLYELTRDSKADQTAEAAAVADSGELERITRMLLDVLLESGYVKRYADNSTEDKIRRLVRRLHLPARDAEVWMGILRQILWKTRDSSHDRR